MCNIADGLSVLTTFNQQSIRRPDMFLYRSRNFLYKDPWLAEGQFRES